MRAPTRRESGVSPIYGGRSRCPSSNADDTFPASPPVDTCAIRTTVLLLVGAGAWAEQRGERRRRVPASLTLEKVVGVAYSAISAYRLIVLLQENKQRREQEKREEIRTHERVRDLRDDETGLIPWKERFHPRVLPLANGSVTLGGRLDYLAVVTGQGICGISLFIQLLLRATG